jgi:glucosamine kinase
MDGGGTKTRCALGDESHTLAVVTSGPSNIVRVGEERSREALQEGVRRVCAAAGISANQIAYACIGGSGAGRAQLAETLRKILAEILPTPFEVVGDMQILLEAAFDTGPGVAIIAGTGSSAYGRNARGETARAGGWGYAIGDEGSAHWIGRRAVAAVLRAGDEAGSEEPHGSLASALCELWQAHSLIDLARMANSNPPPDFSALFPVIAASSDEIAREILTGAGRELARIAGIVMKRLFGAGIASIPVAVTGGVFRYAAIVRDAFYNELRALDQRAQINLEIVEPVEGALRIAKRASNSSQR